MFTHTKNRYQFAIYILTNLQDDSILAHLLLHPSKLSLSLDPLRLHNFYIYLYKHNTLESRKQDCFVH